MKKFRALAACFLALLALCPAKAAPALSRPPNVILILADDMAIGDIATFNRGLTRTPTLDKLIRDGLWFERAYSASPVCAPARAGLLTGRYPHRTGVVSLDLNQEPEFTTLHPDETTLADIFAANGYRTGLVGKWHIGLGEGRGPLARGFQEIECFHGSDGCGYFNYAIQTDDRMALPLAKREVYLTDELNARAIAFVRRHAKEPFFLHLAHYAPHRPLEAPPEAVQPYRAAGFDEQTATVYAMVEIMDRGLGQLLRELETLGLREQTLLLFASDNGPDILVPKRFNLDLRGGKYMIHEGGIRVPFVASQPGHIKPGQRGELIHFTDVLPTLVDFCGLKFTAKKPLDGRSFAPLLRGENAFAGPPRFWQWNRSQPNYTHNAALRDGPWKLVRPFVTQNKIKGDSPLPFALYQLDADPQETTDLAAQHPDRVQSMRALLEQWATAVEQDRARHKK